MKRLCKIVIGILTIVCLFSCKKEVENKVYTGSVMLYSSLEEKYLMALKNAFENKYKGITLDYYFSTPERITNRLTAEAESYQIEADVLLVGNQLDAEKIKSLGYIEKYVSKESKKIPKNLKDKNGYYVAARTAALGLGYSNVEPKNFNDLLDKKYKDNIFMTDPNKASIYKFFVACMMQDKKYGEEYFIKLKENGLKLSDSALSAIDDVRNNEESSGILLDYVVMDYNDDVRNISFKYSNKDMYVMITPVALIKNAINIDNGKLLIDFILSKEGQEILINSGYMSSRKDMKNSIHTEKFISKSKKINFATLSENYNIYIEKFNNIIRG